MEAVIHEHEDLQEQLLLERKQFADDSQHKQDYI